MGCPARMSDADGSGKRIELEHLFEIDDLAFGTAAGNTAIAQRRHAGGIIASVFQTLQPLDQQADGLTLTNNADYSAHVPSIRFSESPEAARQTAVIRFGPSCPFQPDDVCETAPPSGAGAFPPPWSRPGHRRARHG